VAFQYDWRTNAGHTVFHRAGRYHIIMICKYKWLDDNELIILAYNHDDF